MAGAVPVAWRRAERRIRWRVAVRLSSLVLPAVLLIVFKLLSRLPLGWVQALGGLLGRLVPLLSADYRARLHENLAQAGFDAPAMAAAAAAEAGKQSLTPHLGSFEAIAQSYALRPEARTRPMTALYRRPRKDVLLPLMQDARAKEGLLLAPADMRGVRMLMRAVKNRGVVGILPDQVPAAGDGVWAPFFGRPAFTMVLPARLAPTTHAIVLVLGAERRPGGAGFDIHVERLQQALSGDALHDATLINGAIERMVARFPLQYLWGYNRYKKPANAPEPPAAAEPPAPAVPPAAR
jgi:Kdo2-lipid IVA lauroyltransferase/acyltransferase